MLLKGYKVDIAVCYGNAFVEESVSTALNCGSGAKIGVYLTRAEQEER